MAYSVAHFPPAAVLPVPQDSGKQSAFVSNLSAGTLLVPLAGMPTFLQPTADQGPLWIPSAADFDAAAPTAAQVCNAWGGSIASLLSPSFTDALTAELNQSVRSLDAQHAALCRREALSGLVVIEFDVLARMRPMCRQPSAMD